MFFSHSSHMMLMLVSLLVFACGGTDGVKREKNASMGAKREAISSDARSLIPGSYLTCNSGGEGVSVDKGLVKTTCAISPDGLKQAKFQGNNIYMSYGQWVLQVPNGTYEDGSYVFSIDLPAAAIQYLPNMNVCVAAPEHEDKICKDE